MLFTFLVGLAAVSVYAQTYELRREHDSLYWLNEWRLPYPVYQFQTGDIDGDGRKDALVGVVKTTRFYPELGRRLFIFKQIDGRVRPLWLGSKLGGILHDFRFADGCLLSLELTTDNLYVVAEYRWASFGMAFERFIVKGTDKETAHKYFLNYEDKNDFSHGVHGWLDSSLQPEAERGSRGTFVAD